MSLKRFDKLIYVIKIIVLISLEKIRIGPLEPPLYFKTKLKKNLLQPIFMGYNEVKDFCKEIVNKLERQLEEKEERENYDREEIQG